MVILTEVKYQYKNYKHLALTVKYQSLINTYQYYLQMIRDVTGLNEARDGSMPDKDSLVGLQKMAANASNTATKHILNAADVS